MVYESLASITINCTDKCNMNCPYCNHHEGKNTLELDKIFSIYKDSVSLQSNYIVIAGGEPLLHPDIHEIIKKATEYGLFSYLFTNGVNLTRDMLIELKKDGLAAIRLTLDSIKKEKQDKLKGEGALENIKAAIQEAIYVGIGININTPVGIHNIDEIDEIVEFCIDNKVRTLRISPLVESSKEDTKKILKKIICAHEKFTENLIYDDFAEYTGYDEFLNIIKSANCPGGVISINVNADGVVSKCPYVDEKIGNIYENSLLSLWMEGYEKQIKDKRKCIVADFDIYEMFLEMKNEFPETIVKKCISAWISQVKGKKKICYRDLPCWYFVFR